MHALLHSLLTLQLVFFTDLESPLFCEFAEAIKLTCSETFINNLLVYVVRIIFLVYSYLGLFYFVENYLLCLVDHISGKRV